MTTERERFEQEWYSQRAAMSRMDVAWHFWQAALAGRDAAPPSLTFTLREADQLLGTFGDENTLVTVRALPVGAVKDEDSPDAQSPAGLWAHFTEQPQEGAIYLGPGDDPDEEYVCDHDAAPPAAQGERSTDAATALPHNTEKDDDNESDSGRARRLASEGHGNNLRSGERDRAEGCDRAGEHDAGLLHPQQHADRGGGNAARVTPSADAPTREGLSPDAAPAPEPVALPDVWICHSGAGSIGADYKPFTGGARYSASPDAVRDALRFVRHRLEAENERGAIADTLWATPHETLFDYIDAILYPRAEPSEDAARRALGES